MITGEEIQAAREMLGWRQADLAERRRERYSTR
jgi:ribosome-binding protein aMBF1 (putative translation factor)